MSDSNSKDTLDYAGDYNLGTLTLINHVGEPLPLAMGTVAELNVYEDITANTVTGSMHIIDFNNIITNAELQGNERLLFKLSTPGTAGDREGTVDATEETGYPFHIYALTDRKQYSETAMTYVLHFCSKELFRNVRTKVSKAYDNNLALSVVDILRDKNGLNSRKNIHYEETRNADKIVIPNMRPFDAISMLSNKSLSKNAKGAGYHFYETSKGFHFRSYESMLAYSGLYEREEKLTLSFEPSLTGKPGERVYLNQHNIDSYEVMQHFDTLAQQAMGTYASRIITHNMYDKSYNIQDYHYHDHFSSMFHADQTHSSSSSNFPISDTPVDLDVKDDGTPGDKTVSDYPNSNVVLQSSTRFLHDENTGIFGTDPDSEGLTEAIRMSQRNQVHNSQRIKIVMPGHSYVQAGDVIRFKLPSLEPNKGERTGLFDSKHAGRYVISKLRHRVVLGEYKMVLECVKDSVMRRYTNMPNELYPLKKEPLGEDKDIYIKDGYHMGERMGPHSP